jgi:hypothetical protein
MDDRSDIAMMTDCWRSFAVQIIQYCVPFNEPSHYQQSQRLITLMQMADWQTSKSGNPIAHDIIRRQLSTLLRTWLECIRSMYSDEGLSASAVPSMDSINGNIQHI